MKKLYLGQELPSAKGFVIAPQRLGGMGKKNITKSGVSLFASTTIVMFYKSAMKQISKSILSAQGMRITAGGLPQGAGLLIPFGKL